MQKATKGWGLVNTSSHSIGAYYISDEIMLHFSANEQDLRSTYTALSAKERIALGRKVRNKCKEVLPNTCSLTPMLPCY
jgi:hypothetical protein